MMTIASCGTVSAHTLGLSAKTAIPASKGELPKQVFYAKATISSRLKKHFTDQVESITMLGLLRSTNTGLAEGARCREILVLGIRITGNTPEDVLSFIASRRASGIIFVIVRDADATEDGTAVAVRQECALAVCRKAPGRVGHIAESKTYVGPWKPAGEARLTLRGTTLDEAWDSFCAQAILGDDDGMDLDARIRRRDDIASLRAQIAKLERDHGRARQPAQRNEIYAKLHKARKQLDDLMA